MPNKIEIDFSQELPEAEWNSYGDVSRRTPKVTCLQIQWDGLTGTLDGTLLLEISNQLGHDPDSNEFVTKVPLLDEEGNEISLDSASNKSNCYMQKIEIPHGSWRLTPSKGGITGGTLKALMIEASN